MMRFFFFPPIFTLGEKLGFRHSTIDINACGTRGNVWGYAEVDRRMTKTWNFSERPHRDTEQIWAFVILLSIYVHQPTQDRVLMWVRVWGSERAFLRAHYPACAVVPKYVQKHRWKSIGEWKQTLIWIWTILACLGCAVLSKNVGFK